MGVNKRTLSLYSTGTNLLQMHYGQIVTCSSKNSIGISTRRVNTHLPYYNAPQCANCPRHQFPKTKLTFYDWRMIQVFIWIRYITQVITSSNQNKISDGTKTDLQLCSIGPRPIINSSSSLDLMQYRTAASSPNTKSPRIQQHFFMINSHKTTTVTKRTN